jgi:hypothetical protein
MLDDESVCAYLWRAAEHLLKCQGELPLKRLSLLLLLFCGLLVPASAQDVTGLVDNGDGTITDTRSGLMWLKSANQGGARPGTKESPGQRI